MAAQDLSALTPDEDKFGETLARTKRIISKLFMDWTNYSKDSRHTSKSRAHLTSIYFDKLAEFHCRLWDYLCECKVVRYSSGFESRPGFHGPGRALQIDREQDEQLGVDPEDTRHTDWAYITEIIDKLKPLGNTRSLFRLSGDPWKPNCKISPGIDEAIWKSWLINDENPNPDCIFLNTAEIYYVNKISDLIMILNQEELRAIGTHCSVQNTFRDIRLVNLSSWEKYFNNIALWPNADGKQIDFDRISHVLITTSSEVKRKSVDNKQAYKVALKKILNKCADDNIKKAIKEVQQEAHAIWDDELIVKCSKVAQAILDLSLYIRRSLNCMGVLARRLSVKEIKETDEAYERLREHPPSGTSSINLYAYSEVNSADFNNWWAKVILLKQELFAILPPRESYRRYV